MTKTTSDALSEQIKEAVSGDPKPDTAEAAISEALTTRTPRTGVNAALDALRKAYDESAHVVWTTTGPRRSHTEEIAAVLVEFDAGRKLVIVLAMASGAYKLFAEVPGKASDIQVWNVGQMIGQA